METFRSFSVFRRPGLTPATLGSYALVLHSHIPYVLAHGRWPHGMDWLAEVAAETYVPLLDVLDRLVGEGISPRLTLGLTPVLCEQLADPTFQDEFLDYLDQKVQTAKDNQQQFKFEGNMHMLGLAHYWEEFYSNVRRLYTETYGQDIVGAIPPSSGRGPYRNHHQRGHTRLPAAAPHR